MATFQLFPKEFQSQVASGIAWLIALSEWELLLAAFTTRRNKV